MQAKVKHFTLYSDENDSYRYEQGLCQRIQLDWNNKRHTLTIGQREGSYEGMPEKQTFRIILHHHNGTTTQREVQYTGKVINSSIK